MKETRNTETEETVQLQRRGKGKRWKNEAIILVHKEREKRRGRNQARHDSAIAKGQSHYVGTDSRMQGEEKETETREGIPIILYNYTTETI